MTKLTIALGRLQRWLRGQKIPFMIIGGVANFIWGEPRLTQDIDVTIEVPEEKVKEFVENISSQFKVLPKEKLDFVKATRVLPIDVGGVEVDMIFAGLEYEKTAIQRATEVGFEETKIKVCSPEDLIIHKAISERERDWEDIEGILLKRGQTLDKSYLLHWLEGFSQALEKPNILKRFEKMWAELIES